MVQRLGKECRLPVGKRGEETTVRSAGRFERGSIMKHRLLVASWIAVLLAVVWGAPGAQAQTTYTWTGDVDGDWTNTANWDANGVPVDVNPGRTGLSFQTSADRIVIDATNFSPTTNVPQLNPDNSRGEVTATVDVINGSVVFSLNSSLTGQNIIDAHTFTTIGDGDASTGLASLRYTNPGTFRRHDNFTMAVTVKSDGSLIFGGNTTVSFDGNKRLHVTLAGGSTTFNGTVRPLRNSTAAGNSWFDFTAEGATFTATFGGAVFVDLATVNTFIDDGEFFRASTGLKLAAKDNGDNTFTVFIPPPAGTMILFR